MERNCGLTIPHGNLSDEINRGIVQSEIEGGVYLSDLTEGACLEVETQNHRYSLVKAGDGAVWISGHPLYCPKPVEVRIGGSSWGGSLLKASFIGRGMRMEFWHPEHQRITTSRILEVRQVGEKAEGATASRH